MSSNESRGADDVALRDLVVGEPAVHRALDGEAARAKAEQLVRDVGADPRLVAVVGKISDTTTQPGLGDPSVREGGEQASEIQRPTHRMPASAQITSPNLDTHSRVTDPRLDQRGPGAAGMADASDASGPSGASGIPGLPGGVDEVDEALDRAQRSLRANAGRARADHQRLAVLGATALAVGIILLALVLTRETKKDPQTAPTAPPTAGTADPNEIPVETVFPPTSNPTPTSPTSPSGGTATPPGTGAATPPTTGAATPQVPPVPATGPTRPAPNGGGVETNPKSSAPRPGPSQDVPGPSPKPSTDRPF